MDISLLCTIFLSRVLGHEILASLAHSLSISFLFYPLLSRESSGLLIGQSLLVSPVSQFIDPPMPLTRFTLYLDKYKSEA